MRWSICIADDGTKQAFCLDCHRAGYEGGFSYIGDEVFTSNATHDGRGTRTVDGIVGSGVDATDWRRCGFLRHQGEREDCEMRSGEECYHDATKCKYWHER